MGMKKSIRTLLKGRSKGERTTETATIDQNNDAKEKVQKVREYVHGFDRDHVWAFNSGQRGRDFRGNPKYLFVYINKYRPDIRAYWICDDDETVQQVRDLGFHAYHSNSVEAQYIIDRTGVYVAEQVKLAVPTGFENAKYINLWHGVGTKTIERKLFEGDIAMGLARKYVKKGTFYRDNQLMVVTCPMIEEEFITDCGLDKDKVIRSGYPRCLYQQNFDPISSFDHDIRAIKGLPSTTKLCVYAPTYRAKLGGTFSKAIVDFEKLYQVCEEKDLLLIFKVHPNMENEVGFRRAWEAFGDRKRFLFWDNRNDFYEIMHEIDLAIIDYSSIITDMVAMGIPHYIRYLFDYDEYAETESMKDDFLKKTTGEICRSFEELLHAMSSYEERNEKEDIERLNREYWSYSDGKEDFDKIIQEALDFEINTREFRTLYSFDVFDTVFSRKVLDPSGIFYKVRDKMREEASFPPALTKRYPKIRYNAEMNVREYYKKTKEERGSEAVEIHFDEIFERIADVYGIDERQKTLLRQWETEAELENVIPLRDQIDFIKELKQRNETVVLISDMYLPKKTILDMLTKADPVLAELPLFLSNEYGVQKTTQKLFFEVYKSFEPFYDFEKWIHYGDNEKADIIKARKFRINTRRIIKPEMNEVQRSFIEAVDEYDAFLIAAMQARLCLQHPDELDQFVISYISFCFVPYIDWVLRDAQERGYETLYFISRDGYHLKRIADAIIQARKLCIKTKYIYGSRRTWRIPSFVDEIDPRFWDTFGSFKDINSKEKLFSAMSLTEEEFKEFFPYIDPDRIDFTEKKEMKSLIDLFRNSEEYSTYLLDDAKEKRVLVEGYLKQEIDFSEKYAFVEYYGRGHTQDCLNRLIQHLTRDRNRTTDFYYSRTILPTQGDSVRFNFTTNSSGQFFIESIFANMPYKSIQDYMEIEGKIQPIIQKIPYNRALFISMQKLLPLVAEKYASLELEHPIDTDQMAYEFVFDYYEESRDNINFVKHIASLVDSVALYGGKREFAPPLTEEDLNDLAEEKIKNTSMRLTTDIVMSYTRSSAEIQKAYRELYQVLPGDSLEEADILSTDEVAENRKYQALMETATEQATIFQNVYEQIADEVEVQKKVLILHNQKSLKYRSLGLVQKKLEQYDGFELKTIKINKTSYEDEELAEELASARIILISSPIGFMSKIKLKEESEMILLNDTAFPLFNQNLAYQRTSKWRTKYQRFISNNDISTLQIPAKYQEPIFRKFYSNESATKCDLLGCCVTDQYFSQEFRENSLNKLHRIFPESKGKKVVLYIPYVKSRNKCMQWLDILNMELLQNLIGEEYVVAINFHSDQVKRYDYCNEINIPGFSMEISKGISIRELIVACDVVIGNYRNAFFEVPLLRKPAYLTTYDYEYIVSKPNISCRANHFEEYVFCPVIKSSEDLARELDRISEYDYNKQDEFRSKYLSDCDGKSTDRVKEYIIGRIQG